MFLFPPFLSIYATEEAVRQVSFNLPVNAMPTPKVHMVFEVPVKFVASAHGLKEFTAGELSAVEFVPYGESVENWSEMYTVNSYLGKRIPAQYMVTEISKNIVAQTKRQEIKNFEVLAANFETAKAFIQYETWMGLLKCFIWNIFQGQRIVVVFNMRKNYQLGLMKRSLK